MYLLCDAAADAAAAAAVCVHPNKKTMIALPLLFISKFLLGLLMDEKMVLCTLFGLYANVDALFPVASAKTNGVS